MADVLLGSSERRVLITSALPPAPAPESLLCRLDQIDFRLRKLEEQRRGPAAAHADDSDVVRRAQHQHTKSLPSALQHVQLRGTLMDRLNLLESRIRQLSCELDLDDDYAGKAALGLGTSSAPVLEPCRDPGPPMMCMSSDKPADESWSAVEILHKDARHKPNPSNKVSAKSLKEAKCACQKEKKKTAEGNKTKKRSWFGVGC